MRLRLDAAFMASLIEEGKSMSIIIYLKERLRHKRSKETFCDFYHFFVFVSHMVGDINSGRLKTPVYIAIGGFFISLTTGYSFGT